VVRLRSSTRNQFWVLMSFLSRPALNGVHPWVAGRVAYILEYADRWGPRYSVTSGVRSAQKQYDLYLSPGNTAVPPGCSQHQYGVAVDVWWQDPAWNNWYLQSARNFGLTTVRGDPLHVQAYPGVSFRNWSQRSGFCPDSRFNLALGPEARFASDPWSPLSNFGGDSGGFSSRFDDEIVYE